MIKKSIVYQLVSAIAVFSMTACGQEEILLNQQANNVNALSSKNSNETLTLATYNIRNLFDGVQNPGKAEEKPKPEKELKALADAIHDIKADVIALEEVESKGTLKSFAEKYLKDLNYQVVLREANDPRGIDVAVLSKLPVLSIKSHKNVKINVSGQQPSTFSRDLLQLKLKTANNYNFTLFVTHLKSQHGEDQADNKRKAEAMKIREIVRDYAKKNPKDNYLIVGDFNDVYNAPSLEPILNSKKSDLNLTDIILKDLGSGPDVYSYHPQKFRSRIDYMLISPTMMNEYESKSVNIHKFPENTSFDKWTFYTASDHLPITAKFNTSVDK